MTTIWEKLALKWRIQKPKIDMAKLDGQIDGTLKNVKEIIETSIHVPSALDDIFADDDNEDEW